MRGAILNSQFEFPSRRITINLAPADLPKEGGRFDLPIALGILAASGQINRDRLGQYEFLGELALGGELRGNWQSYWLARSAAQAGPLAQAHALLPAIAAAPASSGVTLAQVQGSAVWGGLQWHADVVAQAERPEGGPGHSQATVMEGYAAGTLGNWQWSLGRKVVGWDVGYGFRPNDVVQQEVRRLLVAVPLQGRPVLMAERYTPDAAWSLVAVNPTTERSATGAREPALAARWYQRLGAADVYAFARWGQRTRGSLRRLRLGGERCAGAARFAAPHGAL